ncbi:hypothetical protein DNTS_018320 [Danionella cerebrum]|uniref:Uncharacterized protein n=1 Tax=Danionella cerebrum TaxID=2873325 RepID=A0A553QEQ9_9TELE|nr:hypothetical protein DNTS_018320 [Danionella translucida]
MEDGVDLLACVCSHIIASEEHQPRSSGRLSEEDQTHVVMQRSRGVRTRAQRRVHEEQKPEGGGSREQEPRRAQRRWRCVTAGVSRTGAHHLPPTVCIVASCSSGVLTGAGVLTGPLSGKRGQQKRPWLPLEVAAVERHMSGFISSLTVPAKNDCDLCLQAEPQALSRRDWRNVKFYIHNRILALKRNLRSPEQSLHSQFELGPNQSSQSELADHQNFQTKHLMMESFQHHLSSELF